MATIEDLLPFAEKRKQEITAFKPGFEWMRGDPLQNPFIRMLGIGVGVFLLLSWLATRRR